MPNRFGARSIHTAAKEGHVNVINTLIRKGEAVDTPTGDGLSSLHIAVEHGKAAVVEALLGHGANVHLKVDLQLHDVTRCHSINNVREGRRERPHFTLRPGLTRPRGRSAPRCWSRAGRTPTCPWETAGRWPALDRVQPPC